MNGMGWMSRHALLFLPEEHKKDNGGGAAADYRFVEQASRPPQLCHTEVHFVLRFPSFLF